VQNNEISGILSKGLDKTARRFTQEAIYGIIASQSVMRTGIQRRTFYNWYKRHLEGGYDGLAPKAKGRRQTWNKIPLHQQKQVVRQALEHEELSSRELAYHIIDHHKWFISESSVYRILKRAGLITSLHTSL